MALIKCPECGKEISDKAPACPNCGCPIAPAKPQTYQQYADTEYQETDDDEEEKDGFGYWIKYGLKCFLGVIAFIFVAGTIMNIFTSKSKNKEVLTNETYTSSYDSTQIESESVDTVPVQEIVYDVHTVGELVDALKDNPLKAKETYKDTYVEITGKLSNIDASGDYLDLNPIDLDYCFTNVQCYIKDDDVKGKVMDMSIGDTVTLRGQITDVGEIIGYSLDIHSIN